MARKDKSQQSPTSEKPLDTSSLFEPITETDVTSASIPTEEKPKKSKVREIKPPESVVVCGNDEANAMLGLIQPISAWAAARFYGYDKEICNRAFRFNDSQREKISPPLIRVMNKWLPMLVKKYADEIGLGIVLLSTVNAQARVAGMLDAQEKRRAAEKVTPISPAAEPAPPVETAKAGD